MPLFGAIRGSVLDEAGKPIKNARVYISEALPSGVGRPAAPPVITGRLVTTARVDSNGQFVAFVPQGRYVSCASTTTQGLLNPCHWGTSAPEFDVVGIKTTTDIKIVMPKGAVIPIHVSDPKGILSSPKAAIEQDCRFHVVTAKGYYHEALIVAHSGASRDYAITGSE